MNIIFSYSIFNYKNVIKYLKKYSVWYIIKMNCPYCNNEFKTKGSLVIHQKTAKYCLKIQGSSKKKQCKYECVICFKKFTQKVSLQRHATNHTKEEKYKTKNYIEQLKEKDDKIVKKDAQLAAQQDTIDELKQQVRDLNRNIENIAIKAVTRPSTVTTTNNNNQTLNYNEFKNISPEFIKGFADQLTIEDVKSKDGVGYARFATEGPLKDNVACTDYSRRKLKLKMEDRLVDDPEGSRIWQMLCRGIKDRNDDIFKELIQENIFETEGELAIQIADDKHSINRGIDGERSELMYNVIKHIANRSVV
jgi:DNA-binding helix-hairpin-helix protein with protein kinase domain